MSSENIDYAALLPNNLRPLLAEAAFSWRSSAKAQNDILLPLFTGIDGYKPDAFSVQNNINTIGQAPIELCQDIASYAQLFASLVGSVKDRKTLATSLQVIANRWRKLDPSKLTTPQAENRRLLAYDGAEVKSIGSKLSDLTNVISKWSPSTADPLFGSSLFSVVSHILDPIARFPNTAEGVARFADAIKLSIQAVEKPFKEVFHHPLLGNPISTPDMVSRAVTALAERITDYFGDVDKVVNSVDGLVENLTATGVDTEEVPKGIVEFAGGSTSSNPVGADAAKKAWTEVGEASRAYVSAIVGKASSANAISSFAQDLAPSAVNVQDALGPPVYGAGTLVILAKQTLKTSSYLATITTLPYVKSFKVKVDGTDVSLFEVVLKTRKSYESFQSRIIAVVKDINGYSAMQESIFPIMLNDLPENLKVDTLYHTWTSLANSYVKEAIRVAQDGQELFTQFKSAVDTLKTNLGEVRALIEGHKPKLSQIQATTDALKAESIITGFLSPLFTLEAIGTAYGGQGEVIEEIGGNGGESLYKTIEDSIKAGELAVLVHKIEKIITIAENTSAQLDSAAATLEVAVGSMTKIEELWNEINSDLHDAQSNFSSWVSSALVTDSVLESISTQWTSLKNSSTSYIETVLGVEAPTARNSSAVPVTGILNMAFSSVSSFALSTEDDTFPKEVNSLTSDAESFSGYLAAPQSFGRERVATFMAIQGGILDQRLYNSIKAPSFSLPANRYTLDYTASAYRQAADWVQDAVVATEIRKIATNITNTVIPSVIGSVDFYKTFASRQAEALSVTPTIDGMQNLAAQNAATAETGLQKARASQTIVLDFKSAVSLLNNSMIQRTRELELTLSRLQSQLQEEVKEAIREYIKLALESRPTPESPNMTRLKREIHDLNFQLMQQKIISNQVEGARKIVDPFGDIVTNLTTSWSDLTQQATNLSAFLKIISDVPATAAAMVESARESWDSLNADLARW